MCKLPLHRRLFWTGLLGALAAVGGPALAQRYLSGIIWPEPPVVTPGEGSGPPSDAKVLFDGKNFDAWDGAKGWKVDPDGGFTVKGNLKTKERFGDCQLHLEFASPKPVKGKGQGRGNNGVGLMGARYEIQILDSYENKTYVNGQAGSVYKQHPPLVNANRKPGEWQAYDVIWTMPTFNADGSVKTPAYVTAFHNGVLIQNHAALKGETVYIGPPSYKKYESAPIKLQAHGDPSEPISFRNIWVREL
jgi:Domain of Unknown Function (DUF1080)